MKDIVWSHSAETKSSFPYRLKGDTSVLSHNKCWSTGSFCIQEYKRTGRVHRGDIQLCLDGNALTVEGDALEVLSDLQQLYTEPQ